MWESRLGLIFLCRLNTFCEDTYQLVAFFNCNFQFRVFEDWFFFNYP